MAISRHIHTRLISRVATLLLSAAFISACFAQAPATRKKVIFDQDTDGIIGGNNDPLIMLLNSPNIEVLGVTIGTGNGWLKQETADMLKLLEVVGRPDVPVYQGAEFPLFMPREMPVMLTKMFGGSRTDPFLGAYAEASPGPEAVTPPPGGFAKLQPQKGHAAEFIIKSIREHPGEVSIYCGGALTNVALAISLDPGIIPLTKEFVFMGTSPEFQPKTVNVIYDPESAKIVLHAPWPKITIFTVDVAEKVHRTPEMAVAIAKGQNKPLAQLYQQLVVDPHLQGKSQQWFRMPDELMAAYLIDPTLITETRRYYVDIDTMPGMNYAASAYWDEVAKGYAGIPWPDQPEPKRQKPVPPPGARVANIAWDFDIPRFTKLFLELMTQPMRKP
jgi:inosine-uridine nucleoside N-ribohydrolase